MNLCEIDFPKVKEIEESAFEGCESLKYVEFGVSYDDLVQISSEAIVKENCIYFTSTAYYIDIFKILKSKKADVKQSMIYTNIQDYQLKELRNHIF